MKLVLSLLHRTKAPALRSLMALGALGLLPGAVPGANAEGVAAATGTNRPNILLICADDLGFGDLSCYGATQISTPNIDKLAKQGVRFIDAHSACAVCNPSRYSILSGTQLFHAKRRNDYSLYFHEGQVTLPNLLKSAGYSTAALGKWHNGFGQEPEPDWNKELKPGPIEIGFDSFFGTPKSHNEAPYVFVQDHLVVGLDPKDPIRMNLAIGAHGEMTGGMAARAARPDDQIDQILTEKACAYISDHKEGNGKEKPFFLYLAFEAPHVPLNPPKQFRGKSKAGLYGDFIQELDDCVGRVLDSLEKAGLEKSTLVIFTSDNGGVYHKQALNAGHRCNGILLGQKTDTWEGGHRVPLIGRWPGHFPADTIRKPIFTQLDLMGTFAEAASIPMPHGASPDGASDLAAFTHPETAPASTRPQIFIGVKGMGLRVANWILLPYQGSGGLTIPERQPPWSEAFRTMGLTNSDLDDIGNIKPDAPKTQLYNLDDDLPEHRNLAPSETNRVLEMSKILSDSFPRGSPRN